MWAADIQSAPRSRQFAYSDDPGTGKGSIRACSHIEQLLNCVREGEQAYIAYIVTTPPFPQLGGEHDTDHALETLLEAETTRISPLWRALRKKGYY